MKTANFNTKITMVQLFLPILGLISSNCSALAIDLFIFVSHARAGGLFDTTHSRHQSLGSTQVSGKLYVVYEPKGAAGTMWRDKEPHRFS